MTYLSLSPNTSTCETVWETTYAMSRSCFQLISISSPKQLMKTNCSLYENNSTLCYLLLYK